MAQELREENARLREEVARLEDSLTESLMPRVADPASSPPWAVSDAPVEASSGWRRHMGDGGQQRMSRDELRGGGGAELDADGAFAGAWEGYVLASSGVGGDRRGGGGGSRGGGGGIVASQEGRPAGEADRRGGRRLGAADDSAWGGEHEVRRFTQAMACAVV